MQKPHVLQYACLHAITTTYCVAKAGHATIATTVWFIFKQRLLKLLMDTSNIYCKSIP